MKLSVKIPIIIGAVMMVTSVSIGLIALQVSSRTLERVIIGSIGDNNQANAEYLKATLNG